MESILETIKQMLGPSAEDTHFDPEIITHINSVLMDLNQMGVGPTDGFVVEDSIDTWNDFVQEELRGKIEAIKSYVHLRVKLLFDISSLGSATIASYERQIEKWEWRITEAVELAKTQST